jgi:hypothetical protein
MPTAGENAPLYNNPQAANLDFLYQRQRSRLQALETVHSRPKSLQSHDLGRREGYGEKLTRLYPRELYVSFLFILDIYMEAPGKTSVLAAVLSMAAAHLGVQKETAAYIRLSSTLAAGFDSCRTDIFSV